MKKEVLKKVLKTLMCLLTITCILNFKVYAAEPEIIYTGKDTIENTYFSFKIKQNEHKIEQDLMRVSADTITILNVEYGYNGGDDSYGWTVYFKEPTTDLDVKVTVAIPYIDATTNDEVTKTGTFNFKYKVPMKPIIKCDGELAGGIKETTATSFSINVNPNGCEVLLQDIDIVGKGLSIIDIDDGPENPDGSFTRVARFTTPEGGRTFNIDVEVYYTINGFRKKVNETFGRKFMPSNIPEVTCEAADRNMYSSSVVEIITYKNGWEINSSQYSVKGANLEKVERVFTSSSDEYVAKLTLKDLRSGDEYTIKAEIDYGTGVSKSTIIKEFKITYGALGSSVGSPDDIGALLDHEGNIGKLVHDFLKIVAAILTFVAVITVGINIILARHKADQRNNSMSGFMYIIIGIILLDVVLLLYNFFDDTIGNLSEQVGEVSSESEETNGEEDATAGYGPVITIT